MSMRSSRGPETLELWLYDVDMYGILIMHKQRQIILTVPMVAALPKGHPLAKRRRIRLNQLADERFVFYSQRLAAGFYEHTIGLCQRAGFVPNVAQEAAQHPTLLVLVAAGYGVALIPALAKPEASADVAFVQIREPWAAMQLCMAWRASDSSPLLTAFLNVVKARCVKATAKKHRPRSARKR